METVLDIWFRITLLVWLHSAGDRGNKPAETSYSSLITKPEVPA